MMSVANIKRGLAAVYSVECEECPLYGECAINEPGGKLACENIARDALTYIEELESRIPTFVSIRSRPPENPGRYLVYSSRKMKVAYYSEDAEWIDENGDVIRISHWANLPEPPVMPGKRKKVKP